MACREDAVLLLTKIGLSGLLHASGGLAKRGEDEVADAVGVGAEDWKQRGAAVVRVDQPPASQPSHRDLETEIGRVVTYGGRREGGEEVRVCVCV